MVLSVQFDFVWSTRYSLFLSVSTLPCLALPCLESLKTVYLSYILVCMFLDPHSCVHRDTEDWSNDAENSVLHHNFF